MKPRLSAYSTSIAARAPAAAARWYRGAPKISQYAQGRDNNFNLIRMLAAIGVLVSHAFPIALGEGAVEPLSRYLMGASLGAVSVMVFFGISGFLVAKSFDRSADLKRFALARVLRIFPALIVVLLATIAVAGIWVTDQSAAAFAGDAAIYFIRNVTLYFLQYELTGVFETNPYGPPINGSLWTLNHEVTCYIALTAAGVLGVLSDKRRMLLAIFGFLVVYTVIQVFEPHPRLNALARLALPFLVGTAFYVWRDRVPLSGPLCAALVAACALLHGTYLFEEVFAVTLVYVVFVAAYLPRGLLLKFNELGDYSYGVYIYAFPMQQLSVWAFGPMTPWENILYALPPVLFCAVLSWVFVEKPALEIVRHKRTRDQSRR